MLLEEIQETTDSHGYVQRTGRAGRPGLDTERKSLFFLPAWAGNEKRCANEVLEPIWSSLFDENLLAEQVLAEISSRIGITQAQLESGFGDKTLWRFQGGKHRMDAIIDLLVRSGINTAHLSERGAPASEVLVNA